MQNTDTRTLTPEIHAAAEWEEEENTFSHVGFSKDIDEWIKWKKL